MGLSIQIHSQGSVVRRASTQARQKDSQDGSLHD